MHNPEFTYLLGMIVGKGTIIREKSNTEIRIEIPHKNLIIEGENAQRSVKASLTDIRDILDPLIDTRISVSSMESKTTLSFTKNNGNFLIREINRYLKNLASCKDFRIPKNVYDSALDIKKEFLRGICDVTAHVRSSNIFFKPYDHRVYIEIPANWFLVIDIANLLMDLDIPVHTIDWGHPNIRDPKLEDYKKGRRNAWFREHQIKIFADEFEKVGFKIFHKMEALEKLGEINKKEWDKSIREKISIPSSDEQRKKWRYRFGHIEINHHKYYWERRQKKRTKPSHPMENDSKIPEIIRGKHFNSWREIAKALGHPRTK